MRIDFELAAKRVGRFFKRRSNGVERFGIGIVGAGGRLADHATRRDEASDIVDVAVGMIVLQAFVDPDHFSSAESLGRVPARRLPSSSHCGLD